MVLVLAVVTGLCIGSFLNVVAWRLPRGESVLFPPSRCPACGHRLAVRDLVPVLSWALLRGRCRRCRAPVSVRYPLVEVLGGFATGLPVAIWGLSLRAAGVAAGMLGVVAAGALPTVGPQAREVSETGPKGR